MSDNRPIGVFDSGLGGLTAVKELRRLLPDESIVYFGDTGRVPYGNNSRKTIEKYARQDEAFLLSRGVKMVVAACGTVSSVAPHTGAELPVPFIEVVTPAVRRALSLTKNGRIGVIGTKATVKSEAFPSKLKAARSDLTVISAACPLFVPLVENGWIDRGDAVTVETARRYLIPLREQGVDVLILGCTHYPILRDIIADVMGDVALVNIGECAAAEAAECLGSLGLLCDGGAEQKTEFFVSDRIESFSNTASILLGSDIGCSVERVDVDIPERDK